MLSNKQQSQANNFTLICVKLAYCTLPFKVLKSDETYIFEDLEDSSEAYPGTPG